MVKLTPRHHLRLNAICPYFTMFPLDFPLGLLQADAARRAGTGGWVLDPFCGRGTTNFAARVRGLPTAGVDTSPIGVAVSRAKMVSPTVDDVVEAARSILQRRSGPGDVPECEFWTLAYDPGVLEALCLLREALLSECSSDARVALQAVILGALHGPLNKREPSYFSNQAPRTFAPKPTYSVSYWRRHDLRPPKVDVLAVIRKRSQWYYGHPVLTAPNAIMQHDCRDPEVVGQLRRTCGEQAPFVHIITSPPYFGMATYIPDHWLRNWFLGGPPRVDYSARGQIGRNTVEHYVRDLRQVWTNVGALCRPGAKMALRFGKINSTSLDADKALRDSLRGTGWRVRRVVPAGSSRNGKRQADSFSCGGSSPVDEVDVSCDRE